MKPFFRGRFTPWVPRLASWIVPALVDLLRDPSQIEALTFQVDPPLEYLLLRRSLRRS